MKNRIKFLSLFSVFGLIFSTYLLYNRREGFLCTNDFISLIIVSAFLIILLIYFKSKNRSNRWR